MRQNLTVQKQNEGANLKNYQISAHTESETTKENNNEACGK